MFLGRENDMDIHTFCEHYYMITRLPLQYFDDSHVLHCSVPETQWKLIPNLDSMSKVPYSSNMYYNSFGFGAFYGFVNLRAETGFLVIGPVKEQPYTPQTLLRLHRSLEIPYALYEQADLFFQAIPKRNLQQLIHHLNFINFVFNGESDSSLPPSENNDILSPALHKEEEENFYWRDTEISESYMYSLGRQMQEYIRQGDADGLKHFMSQSKESHMGRVANDELRQVKNIFIYTVALSESAAIDGGLPPEIAYGIANLYTQQMEKIDEITEIMSLNQHVRIEYAKRVAAYKYPFDADQLLKRIINYVRTHTDQPITAASAARHVGYSRCYISTKFKERLGFGLKEFILRTKLERSRIMLLYTSKSINEISTCLCFSSQSHFQKAFREQYGVTPQYYRKNGFSDIQ
ncbi:helix-turn-helix domain-containing protein [Lachnospiraceae bacterium]|jgi:AraC-like DNA-binding protein|nr:helix-turn-helix domain-containing protein [Lachnospiraceae bacterium]